MGSKAPTHLLQKPSQPSNIILANRFQRGCQRIVPYTPANIAEVRCPACKASLCCRDWDMDTWEKGLQTQFCSDHHHQPHHRRQSGHRCCQLDVSLPIQPRPTSASWLLGRQSGSGTPYPGEHPSPALFHKARSEYAHHCIGLSLPCSCLGSPGIDHVKCTGHQ